MNRYALLVSAFLLTAQSSFAEDHWWLYEFVDANISCKAPGKGNLKLVSMVYRVCDLDHVPEKGIIDNAMYQLGITAGRMCGGSYDIDQIWVSVSDTDQKVEQEHAKELSDRRFKYHETFPFQYVYATHRCR
jgi:hypothetical protein